VALVALPARTFENLPIQASTTFRQQCRIFASLLSGDRSEDIAPTRRALEERLFHSWALTTPILDWTGARRPPASSHDRASCDRSLSLRLRLLPHLHNHAFWSHPDLCFASNSAVALGIFRNLTCRIGWIQSCALWSNPPASSVCAHCD
jgi:hypothetical protein